MSQIFSLNLKVQEPNIFSKNNYCKYFFSNNNYCKNFAINYCFQKNNTIIVFIVFIENYCNTIIFSLGLRPGALTTPRFGIDTAF